MQLVYKRLLFLQQNKCPLNPPKGDLGGTQTFKKHFNKQGLTLVELLIAITVSGIIVSLIFFVYVQANRGFSKQVHGFNKIEEMMQAKNRMDRLFSQVNILVDQQGEKIVYKSSVFSDSSHTLSFQNHSLYIDENMRISNLLDFKAAIKLSSSKTMLLWDAHTAQGEWVGGARNIEMVK